MPALLILWNNKAIRYGFLALAGLVIFYLWAKAAGQKKALSDLKQAPLPNNGNGIPAGWDPKPVANRVFTVLDGVWTAAATKEPVFQELYSLTNDQLTAVYNAFNFLFSSKGKGTLTEWIRDDWNYSIGGKRDPLIDRLVSLNCI